MQTQQLSNKARTYQAKQTKKKLKFNTGTVRHTGKSSKGDNFYVTVDNGSFISLRSDLVLCLSHSDKSCQSRKNHRANYSLPEGSKGTIQHNAVN